MKNNNIKIFTNKNKIAEFLADFFIDTIRRKTSNKNISLFLSGGSTPKGIFSFISKNYKEKINWEKVNIFFTDERCVPPTDKESNFKMINEALLSKVSIHQKNIFRIIGESNPQKEAIRYGEILKTNIDNNNGAPQSDIILLGLGEDGHIASIFPNQVKIYNSNNLCEVAMHPESKQKRITITGKIIDNAKTIIFIVTGKHKSDIMSVILKNNSSTLKLPALLVNKNKGKVVWLLDEESAKRVK